ncbi:hypothetical protein BS78_08G064300 [Paspalum vaginatum]|nr:hypothetical protein BS78_08G064300 [Paspalum vaginatum]
MARRRATKEDIERRKKKLEIMERRKKLEAGLDGGATMSDDLCAICDNGGSVTCCDGVCQRSFHLDDSEDNSCREALGLTKEEAEMIIVEKDFICKNCEYRQHQCFICGSLGSSDGASSQPEVFQCEHKDCGRFYHPKCISQLLYPDSELSATLFELEVAAKKFTCPIHECIVCKKVEDKKDKSKQFAVCRRCPTSYHRKCLPSDIIFKTREGPNGSISMQRAWNNIPRNRILIYCMKHEIITVLKTPHRNHIIFPEGNESHTPETLGAPMKQDMAEREEALDYSSSEKAQLRTPDPSNQNQCSCSSPLDSFAPRSLFMDPYPGSCGWLDD